MSPIRAIKGVWSRYQAVDFTNLPFTYPQTLCPQNKEHNALTDKINQINRALPLGKASRSDTILISRITMSDEVRSESLHEPPAHNPILIIETYNTLLSMDEERLNAGTEGTLTEQDKGPRSPAQRIESKVRVLGNETQLPKTFGRTKRDAAGSSILTIIPTDQGTGNLATIPQNSTHEEKLLHCGVGLGHFGSFCSAWTEIPQDGRSLVWSAVGSSADVYLASACRHGGLGIFACALGERANHGSHGAQDSRDEVGETLSCSKPRIIYAGSSLYLLGSPYRIVHLTTDTFVPNERLPLEIATPYVKDAGARGRTMVDTAARESEAYDGLAPTLLNRLNREFADNLDCIDDSL
ncbi:uncharacterized protein MYCFIDRAFT_171833 [Pseudocercospora fijiensis CIRAD86]|uniref:Uncharacterized protein n=1 Tax=Pseudocercospora fijiensis (strain CIRAD86) TaxID=383855 RepID=M3A4G5_PSEFD|nr:uncharacterized protein MYCFIDRAFT_171833 [Pseudocercospora fijiensis CIRAD86]EME86009.1 hypothetical protein MYCFIDRAFT_171833 [Pseudocercospora fijiensis CIRAD86]